MRMHVKFSRWKGEAPEGGRALGVDGPNTTTPPEGGAPKSAEDDALFAAHTNTSGFPICRVAAVLKAPEGSLAELPAALWVWDDLTEGWYRADVGSLRPNEVTYFSVPALSDPSAFYQRAGSGSLAARLVVPDADTADGEYVIGLASEMGGSLQAEAGGG